MKPWALLVACAALFAVAIGPFAGEDTNPKPDTPRSQAIPAPSLEEDPLTIAASTVGRFRRGRSWYLSVNSAGRAEVTIGERSQRRTREFVVAPDQLARFRKALAEERFFELDPAYGQSVPDGSTTTITITAGKVTRSVSILFLMNWVRSDPSRLKDAARAVRLRMLLRSWFQDSDAVDLAPYDNIVLEAAKRDT